MKLSPNFISYLPSSLVKYYFPNIGSRDGSSVSSISYIRIGNPFYSAPLIILEKLLSVTLSTLSELVFSIFLSHLLA